MASGTAAFVLKAEDLAALNYLPRDHPRPVALTWINRGTDQELRPTTVEMLIRTLFGPTTSGSVRRLHQTSGLRVSFSSEKDRDRFSRLFATSFDRYRKKLRSEVTAVFDRPDAAERCFKELVELGIPRSAISILWKAGQFVQSRLDTPPGHSKRSVIAATAGGGLAGALLGMTVLAAPGVGMIAVGGAAAIQALSTVGAFGGAVGATGGAIARMLSDIDVDDREVPYFEMAIQEGKVFISVDPKEIEIPVATIRTLFAELGGKSAGERDD